MLLILCTVMFEIALKSEQKLMDTFVHTIDRAEKIHKSELPQILAALTVNTSLVDEKR